MTFDKFMCHLCSKQAATQGKLNRHLKTNTKPFRCETCQKGFALRLDLSRHIKARHRAGNERYRCHVESCVFRSNRKDNLRRHQTKSHDAAFSTTAAKKSGKTTSLAQSSHLSLDNIGCAQLYTASNFMQVAASGDLARLETFLEAGLTVETKVDDHSTALHCAARAGQTAAVRYLLMRGASVETRNDKYRLPIHEAILSGSPETVEPLLERTTREGLLAMHEELEYHLARSGNIKIVDAYLARLGNDFTVRHASKKLKFAICAGHDLLVTTLLGDPDVDVNDRNSTKYAPIHVAASFGHTKVMEALIAYQRINKSLQGFCDRQALHIAASKGHTAIVEQLIRHPDVNVNCRDNNEMTPLHYASFNGHWETVSLLLQHWESVENGSCFSFNASQTNLPLPKVDLLQRLLNHPDFGNPNREMTSRQWTFLYKAASKGDCETIRGFLTRKDIDVNMKSWGESPLMIAARNGQVEAVRLLLQQKDIDINQSLYYGPEWTALRFAKERKHDEIVDFLLSHGAIDYNANASSVASTTAYIDNPPSTTLQLDQEMQVAQSDNYINDMLAEDWDEPAWMREWLDEDVPQSNVIWFRQLQSRSLLSGLTDDIYYPAP